MQIPKDDIRNIILESARLEFLEKGYKDASMRSISKQAGVTLSNIYNYFRSKDEIYCAVLRPLLRAFDRMLKNHNREDYLTTDVFTMKSYQRKMIDDFMAILKPYRAELKLLLFQSSGSSLENFRDTFTEQQTVVGLEYMQLMKAKYPHLRCDVSPFFIHTVSSVWLTIFGEIISHDELTSEQTEQFLSEYIAYGTGGWKEIMMG